MIAFIRSPALFLVSTTIWTFGEIVNATNEQVYVANHTPMSHRGRFNAILPLIGGLGFALSSPVTGRVIEGAGLGPAWILLGAVALAVAGGFLLVDRSERQAAVR